jgi:hypothetical protein
MLNPPCPNGEVTAASDFGLPCSSEVHAIGNPRLKSLHEDKVAAQAVLLRWRDGKAQAYGAKHLAIGEAGVSDCWIRSEWNGRCFRLETDRFGLRPVYWAQSGDDVAVAFDLRSLLALGVPAQLDDDSVAVFLSIGSYLSETTPFRAIRALPPGATLTWESGVVEVTSRLNWPRPDASIAREAAIDLYVEIFHAAVARRTARAVGPLLPLSGGLDSTHILLAMNHVGAPPAACVTVEDSFFDNARDVEIARESARRIGVSHRILNKPVSLVAAQRWAHEAIGLRGNAHFWAMPLAAFLQETRPGHFFDGLGGDNLSASSFVTRAWIERVHQGRLRDLADAVVSRSGGDNYRRDIVVPDIWRRFSAEAARDRIAAELARHTEAANPIGRFMFLNRLRTLIAPLSTVAFGRFAEPVFPFLDERVFEFLASLPVSYMFDKSFHRDAITRAYGAGWPAPIAAQRSSRMALRRLLHWREVAQEFRHYRAGFRRVLQRPGRVLNPLRWASFEYQHNVFFSAFYLSQLLNCEDGAFDWRERSGTPLAAPAS